MIKKIYTIIISFFLLLPGCSDNGKKENYIQTGAFFYVKPDNNIWNIESDETLAKSYPEYTENGLTVTPVASYSAAGNNGVIIISKAISKTNVQLSLLLKQSQESFKNRNKTLTKVIEDSYILNGLNFNHYLSDSKVTFTRIYITGYMGNPTEALIVDFLCSPDQYSALASSFKNFILSFRK